MDYKKILEGVVNIINTTKKSDIGFANICTYIGENCPELKESEDERIRKEILTAFSCGHDNSDIYGHGITYGQVRVWFEKQGTPAKLSEEEQNRFAKGILTSCALSFIDYLDAHKYEGKMCVSNGECEDIENAFHNAMWDKLHRYYGKYIEKQGKKNPYKEDFGDLLMDVKFGIVHSQKQDEQIPANSAKTCKDEQKPYGKREECYDCQMNYGGACKGSCAMKRGEQKPEWSEEDNFMYNRIKNLMTDISLAPESINSLSDWLKDLKDRVQPQTTWKPSDEHIHGLIWVINRMPDIKKANEAEAVLRDLLEQLNKLRKE